jgi:hypothetical protein
VTRRLGNNDRSAFFFFGRLTPIELANFHVQNEFLGDGGVIEILGPLWSVWWGSALARDYTELDARLADWLRSLLGCYFLSEGIALGAVKERWVEALDVEVKEAVAGFYDERYELVPAPAEPAKPNEPIILAIRAAARLRELEHVKAAAHEILGAARDRSDEGFFKAFRALECLRRHYDPDDTTDGIKRAWKAMAADLGAEEEPFEVLRAAAISVRHGNRPSTSEEEHAVNVARPRRGELINYAAVLVRRVLARELSA